MKNFILFLKNLLIYFGLYKLKYNFSSTIDFGSKKADNFFKNLIKKSKFVYEYGSGNSTLFMKKNKVRYVSIESKKDRIIVRVSGPEGVLFVEDYLPYKGESEWLEIDSNEIAFFLADHQDQLDTIEVMYE